MLNVIGCITQQRDLRLVLLAGLLCLFAGATSLSMVARARSCEGRMRLFWLAAAGTVAGCGIWGTHFIAMLAFRTGLPVGYDAGLTILSVFIAAFVSFAGFATALVPNRAPLGGAIVGLAICTMHYVGMAAVRVPADGIWNRDYVAASIVIGIVMSALAIHTALRSRTLAGGAAGVLLFTLAICGMHFTAMTAVTYVPNPLIDVPVAVLDPSALALAVAAGAVLIVALGLTGVIVDNHLGRRAVEEAQRLRAHVQELEATKRQLEATSASLAQALVTADAANRTKSEFLASMSHELRTPLNAVIGFSEVMLGEIFGPIGNPRYRDYLEDIHSSSDHLLALINDVLDLSRLDAGDMTLHEEDFKIGELIAETERMMAHQAKNAGVALTTDLDSDLPHLHADRRRMLQVLINLIANAVKFTPSGGSVVIAARPCPEGLRLTVADTGIGIAAKDIPKAFERFGQVDGSLSRKYEGAGLGLPLSRQLVELHGGRLELASEIGGGTTVTLIVPAGRLRADHAAAAA